MSFFFVRRLAESSVMEFVLSRSITHLLPILVINILHVLQLLPVSAAPLSSYVVSSFSSPDPSLPFNHMAVNKISGDVYIGALETLHQLDSELRPVENVTALKCTSSGIENKNRLLVVAPSPIEKLITCGSCDGFCEMRSLANISSDVEELEDNEARVVSIADVNTVGIVAMGSVVTTEGFVGNSLLLFTGVSLDTDPADIYPVAKHRLTDLTFQQRTSEYMRNIDNHFIEVILWNDNLYYIIQRTNFYIGRLCPNSTDKELDSYSEIKLQCSDQTRNYNKIRAAHIGKPGSNLAKSLGISNTDEILYAVLTRQMPSGVQFAICVYEMSDIEEHFNNSILGCMRGEGTIATPIDYLKESTCPLSLYRDATPYLCSAQGRYRFASGVVPLHATPHFVMSNATPTAITTALERNYTVAFIGTEEGNLLKIHILSEASYLYEDVPGRGVVLREMFLEENKEELLFATSSDKGSQVLKISVTNCGQYQSCEKCIGNDGENYGDPYCGWCTLEAKCTRYNECAFPDESTRWLSYNAVECVAISSIQPTDRLPYHQTAQQLNITVAQLPALQDSHTYRCAFDSIEVSATTRGGMVSCVSPPEAITIPDESDHVKMALLIKSTETDTYFVSSDFFFFDCSHFASCSSCVTSAWSCDWCVYDNKCTDDSSTCQMGDTIIMGNENAEAPGLSCPQLRNTSELTVLPVGVPVKYILLGSNLPDDSRVKNYDCILHIEGEEQVVRAIDFNDTTIVCGDQTYMYGENVLTTTVSVSARWNGQNNIDRLLVDQVTLYKCSVNGESCSRCLSPEATPSSLQCGWCGNDCNVIQSDVCQNNNFLNQNQNHQCDPPQITSFYPLSGPVEGNTRLEITGTDLGITFANISAVTVEDVACELTGMEDYYKPGLSVSCLTGGSSGEMSGEIKMTVDDDEEAISMGQFMYRDPIISDFNPKEGPASGGTTVTVEGQYLDTGRNITARIGDFECRNLTVATGSEANCITTDVGNADLQLSLELFFVFDGAERTVLAEFTYMPDPNITDIDRRETIVSGGLNIRVMGDRLNLTQEAKIMVSSQTSGAWNSMLCNLENASFFCPTPPFPESLPTARRRRQATDDIMVANLTFDLDGTIHDEGFINYYPDPEYYVIAGPDQIQSVGKSKRLLLQGNNLNLVSDVNDHDVIVYIGPDGDKCHVKLLAIDSLDCRLPLKQPRPGGRNGTLGEGPAAGLPAIEVQHGNVIAYPGYVKYPAAENKAGLIGGAAAAGAVFIIVLVMIGALLYRRSHKNLDRQAQELELVEKKIQHRVEVAFHGLQADMSEVQEQVQGLGMPFVNMTDYTKNMLFSGLDILPAQVDPEYVNASVERAMMLFSRQLNTPEFIIHFIQDLEVKRRAQRRDRVNIASLITIILLSEGRFDYFTQILKQLLEEQIMDGADRVNLKSLFRRTETIVEKLLSNWLSICMYHFLKKHVAQSLYLLYQSIKIQCEKGPVDIITGQSYFSLNFDSLMEEDVEFQELTLSVVGSNGHHEFYVKVLDMDCITQAKQKILDAAYRRRHFVKQQRAHEMDLMWYHPGGGQRVLRDQDEFNMPTDSRTVARVNTVKSVGLDDNSRVALIEKVGKCVGDQGGNYQPVTVGVQMFYLYNEQGPNDVRQRDYTRIQSHTESGCVLWHLIPEEQMPTDDKGPKTKLDKGFSAPHLLVTKKTIEPFLKDFLAAIFEKPELTPVTVKHLFDFFDEMSRKHCTGKEKPDECAEAWKSNSLPQHYWVTTLTHPSYVFDMRQSRSTDQSVSVLASMLDNACKKIIPEKKEDSSLNRVLFVKDLPHCIQTISTYYKKIETLPTPTTGELQAEFDRIGEEFAGLFSRVGTLRQLYDFTCQDAADLLDSITELLQS